MQTATANSPIGSASVIMCARNARRTLTGCLASLGALHPTAFLEIILVDNGSDDGTFEEMNAFAASAPLPCRVLRELAPGNSAGRNSAVAIAKGEILICIDADCYAAPTLATRWCAEFADPALGYASGRINRFNPDDSSLGCREEDDVIHVPAGATLRRGFIQGSNMAFRARCVSECGGFDVRFGAGTPYAGEEWELAWRIAAAGWTGGYFPGPEVAHDHGRRDGVARERLLFYDIGAGAVYAKHAFGQKLRGLRMLTDELIRIEGGKRRQLALCKGFMSFAADAVRR